MSWLISSSNLWLSGTRLDVTWTNVYWYVKDISHTCIYQGSFCKCTQPMRDDVTMLHRLSLAGHINRMIPDIYVYRKQIHEHIIMYLQPNKTQTTVYTELAAQNLSLSQILQQPVGKFCQNDNIFAPVTHLLLWTLQRIITWLCDILALVWHFGPACVRFRPGLCDILALSCVTKASACHHTPISNTGAVYRKFHRSSVSKTT